LPSILKYFYLIISAIPAFQRPCSTVFAKYLYINGVLPIHFTQKVAIFGGLKAQ
jgi:hypothetical protein